MVGLHLSCPTIFPVVESVAVASSRRKLCLWFNRNWRSSSLLKAKRSERIRVPTDHHLIVLLWTKWSRNYRLIWCEWFEIINHISFMGYCNFEKLDGTQNLKIVLLRMFRHYHRFIIVIYLLIKVLCIMW